MTLKEANQAEGSEAKDERGPLVRLLRLRSDDLTLQRSRALFHPNSGCARRRRYISRVVFHRGGYRICRRRFDLNRAATELVPRNPPSGRSWTKAQRRGRLD